MDHLADRVGGDLEPWPSLDFGRYRDDSRCDVLAGELLVCLVNARRDVSVWVSEVEPTPNG